VIKRLKQGETVTLDDGRVIRPDDIIDRAKTDHEFPNLLIVDIQTEENLESIFGNPILNVCIYFKLILTQKYFQRIIMAKIGSNK
jgi:hypothetical protein